MSVVDFLPKHRARPVPLCNKLQLTLEKVSDVAAVFEALLRSPRLHHWRRVPATVRVHLVAAKVHEVRAKHWQKLFQKAVYDVKDAAVHIPGIDKGLPAGARQDQPGVALAPRERMRR